VALARGLFIIDVSLPDVVKHWVKKRAEKFKILRLNVVGYFHYWKKLKQMPGPIQFPKWGRPARTLLPKFLVVTICRAQLAEIIFLPHRHANSMPA
jgi:hypothetical protein